MARKPKGEGKTEVVTLRLTQRARYGLELLARQQRRTLSSVAEWAFQQAFKRELITSSAGVEKTLEETVNRLWDPLEPDRFVKLAQEHPSLLTFEEDLIWKVIKEEPSFWSKAELGSGGLLNIKNFTPPSLNVRRIRRLWPQIKAAANGERVDFTETIDS